MTDAAGAFDGHVTYCLNVHPGESWAEVKAAVATHGLAVKARVAPDRPFGLGLRLSRRAAVELRLADEAREWRDGLTAQGLYVFTVNGFPYGDFHGTAVKTDVYRPDWRTPERLAYTIEIAGLLATLLPEDVDGSISTVPGSYRKWLRGVEDEQRIARNLATCAAALHTLERRTGREIHLGLEPEPDCMIETTDDAITFFRDRLLPEGTAGVRRLLGCAPAEAERILRRHVGVCVDVCHLAVQFEDVAASVDRLAGAGIRLSKFQVSAAVRAAGGPTCRRALKPFANPVYLHQVKALDWGPETVDAPATRRPTIRAYADLPDYIAACRSGAAPAGEARIHCHVPLDWPGAGGLTTTADALTPALRDRIRRMRRPHVEAETYTFAVLPEALRARPIDESLAAELQWTLAWLQG